MTTHVLSEEEIKNLKDLQQNYASLTYTLGEIEIQILSLQLKKDLLKTDLESLQKSEIDLANQLEQKYGQGTISLEKGEFFSQK